MEVFCHIDLQSYRLEFVKSKPESIGLNFYRTRLDLEQRTRSGRKKKKKKKKKRKGRTDDQIGQEEEESNLEGRKKELRKKKRFRSIRGGLFRSRVLESQDASLLHSFANMTTN